MLFTRLSPSRSLLSPIATLAGLLMLACSTLPGAARAAGRIVPGHIPAAVSTARVVTRLTSTQPMRLALTLPLRDQAGLDELLTRLYTPGDAQYHKFLTSQEFSNRFAPGASQYGALITFAKKSGLSIVGVHANRTVLDVAGPAAIVEKTFGVKLLLYKGADGRTFYAPDREPSVPTALAASVTGIIGLDNATVFHSHARLLQSNAVPHAGTGPNGGLAPSDIKTAYSLTGTQTGSGQTLGLFELDGYKASDISKYVSQFGLTAVPLSNVLVDGATGSAGSGADEVTLDIELQNALAPGATKILVYEAPNSNAGVVDLYNKIATDNLAKEISTSWGEYEAGNTTSALNSENTAFQQMAMQGQSIFAAAGDSGAYDNGSTLSVDDPASQPYVTGCGGTSLTTNGAGGAYTSETTWNGGSVNNGAGGGGISSVWSIPSYQSGVAGSTASKGSTTFRNVPDVSLDADPNTGYAIYVGGAWNIYGGTSCAAPLWSAFTALVNQQRVTNGLALLGFANPSIYSTATSASYGADFHDIADGSTNLYYPAVTGYDDATGWGSFKGASLLTALAGPSTPGFTLAASPTSVSVVQGATGSSTITIGAQNGFTGTVALSASGLPGGVTAAFNPASVTTSGTSTLTFTASASAATGTSTITVTGTSGTLTETATISLTITAAPVPGFTLAASPTSVSVVQSSTGTSTITVGAVNGFTGSVALSASGLPGGVTAAFNPASVTTSGTSTLTFTASATAATGTSTITVTGVSGSTTHTATISLTITATPVPNFTLAASPTSVSVVQGATGSSTITIGAQNGFTGSVALSASGLPGGVTAAFNPASVTTSGTSTLTFTASSTATVGTVTVTVTGVSGSTTHTATISLTITSSGGGITQLLVNPGFETGSISPWVSTAGVLNNSTAEPAHSGSWDAWLDGYGQTHTDTLYQTVAVPSGKTTATLTFWLHIDTAETTKTHAYDTLNVEVRNSSGTVLATLGTYSNLNAASGYSQKTFNLSSYIGQTIQVYLVGSEDSSLQTSFVVDDFALNVQ